MFSACGRESMYARSGFTFPMYSTLFATGHPISMTNHMASGNLIRTCDENQITVSEFYSFTDEIYNFDSQISPVLRNIKWFIETAEIKLLARDKRGKLTGIFLSKKFGRCKIWPKMFCSKMILFGQKILFCSKMFFWPKNIFCSKMIFSAKN